MTKYERKDSEECVHCGNPVYKEFNDRWIHKKCENERVKQLTQYAKEASPIAVLENIQSSKNPNNLISHIDIEDKIECALWCGLMFEKMKPEFIDYGYSEEGYEGFLVQTYVSTKESFPESIKSEIEGVQS